MTDIGKVIEGLQNLRDAIATDFIHEADQAVGTIDDALALLKEQEAVEPIPPIDDSDLWRCGNCGHQMFRVVRQLYCPKCGRAVKWE